MNILFVSSEFPLKKDQATGGIGTYLSILTSGLISQGHKVFLITRGKVITGSKNMIVFQCDFGLKKLNFLKKYIKLAILKRIFNFIEYPLLFSLESFFKIKKIEKYIDIIEGNDFGGELFFYLLLKNNKVPVVLRLHTPSFIIQRFNGEPVSLFYRIMKVMEIYCLGKADSLYSPTKSLANMVSHEIKRPVNTIIPYPFKPLYNYRKNQKNNCVLYVGKLQPKKGVFELAAAIPEVVKYLPRTQFYFIGPDTYINGVSVKSLLIKKFRENKIISKVIFIGNLNKKELYKFYAKALITVIPSRWENFPNVCLEAMSQGSVVIASSEGGLPEIINNKINGLLFNIYKSSDLDDKIISFLKSNHSTKMSHIAIKYIENNFNLNKISKKTIIYYKSIIKSYTFNNNSYI